MEAGGIDGVTGLPTAMADVGNVYKDTANMVESDGQETTHYAELKSDPVVVVDEAGEEMIEFSLMDTSATNLESWCGGTVTTVGTDDTWNKPTTVPNIEKSLRITTEDSTVVTIHRAKIKGKRVLSPTKKGIFLIEVKAKILTPVVDGVPAVSVADPIA